ncbi:hypothetical protein, partial [Ruminococcus callidus]|uniref:hypothetical protein n=1 Tax=Ruminococcus callidus TaxID=40519 RepID=UPI003FD6CD7B
QGAKNPLKSDIFVSQRDKETSIFYRYCVISFVSEVHLDNFWTTKKYFKIALCFAERFFYVAVTRIFIQSASSQ